MATKVKKTNIDTAATKKLLHGSSNPARSKPAVDASLLKSCILIHLQVSCESNMYPVVQWVQVC